MPTFKVYSEVKFDYLSSPGTWLPYADDLFVSVEAFDTCEKSRLYSSIFPIELHERFIFEKFFWDFNDVSDLLDYLKRVPVVVELYQTVAECCHGVLLAYFDTSAREFFYPESDYTDVVETRMIIMGRTSEFSGDPPRLSFSTYTVLDELVSCNRFTTSPINEQGDVNEETDDSTESEIDFEEEEEEYISPPSPSHYTRPVMGNEGFLQHTVNSALRTRTPIPKYRDDVREYVISDIVQHKTRKLNAIPAYKKKSHSAQSQSKGDGGNRRPLISTNYNTYQTKSSASGDGRRQKESFWKKKIRKAQKIRVIPISKRPPFKITKPDENLIHRKPVYMNEPPCECPAKSLTPECLSPYGSPHRAHSRSSQRGNKSPNSRKKSPYRANRNRASTPANCSLIKSPTSKPVRSPWSSPKVYSKKYGKPQKAHNSSPRQNLGRTKNATKPKSQRIHDIYCRHMASPPPVLEDIQAPDIRSRIHQSGKKKKAKFNPGKHNNSNSTKCPSKIAKEVKEAKDYWTSRLNEELKRNQSPSLYSNPHR